MQPRLTLWTDSNARGGIGDFTHSLALGLQSRGYDVTIAASVLDPARTDDESTAGIHHVEITALDRAAAEERAAAAQKLLRDLAPDVVLFADAFAVSSPVPKRAALDLTIPMIVAIGSVLEEHAGVVMDPPVYEKICEAAAGIVVASRHDAERLKRLYPLGRASPSVIPQARAERFFEPANPARRDRLRKEIGAGPDDVVFFTAAKYEPAQAHQIFLQALALLSANPVWKRLRFVWAGGSPREGEIRATLAQLDLADRVHVLDPRADFDAWLDAADAVVLPTVGEGIPLSIRDAMAKGLPTIATAVDGNADSLGDSGILLGDPADPKAVPQTTIQDFARAIAGLAGDAAQREELGRRAKQRALGLFHDSRMVTDYVRLIGTACSRAPAPIKPHDYVSPGFAEIRPDAAFPNMIAGNAGECDWPYLRREIMHHWYVDRRVPTVGFLSRDEAHILYNAALAFADKPALEIGCWLGWSACHLASARVQLDVIDPLLATTAVRSSVEASLRAAGVIENVHLVADKSPDAVHKLGSSGRRWSLIFIDGDHEGAAPRLDAEAVLPYAADDCVVLFHDVAAPAVADGLRFFVAQGWNFRIYRTMQIMAAAWRGRAQPPLHVPDPTIPLSLPLHLADLAADSSFPPIHRRARPFTMTSVPRQFALHQSVRHIVEKGIPGDVVECGVWRGGSMMIVALTLASLGVTDRKLALYDTFSGMVPPENVDVEVASGNKAEALLAIAPPSPNNHYWAVAPLDAVKQAMASTGYPSDRVEYSVGDVCETLRTEYKRPIALLRLDTDWYASTRCELEQLFDRMQPGGVLIVDDYGYWAGAQKACDEFFAGRIEKLHPIANDPVGRIAVKGSRELPPELQRALATA